MSNETNDNNLATLCHVLGLFLGFFGPLIIMLCIKDRSDFLDKNIKESINFQLSYVIYLFVSMILILMFIGVITTMCLLIAYYALMIIAIIKTSNGEMYEYPMTIQFMK